LTFDSKKDGALLHFIHSFQNFHFHVCLSIIFEKIPGAV